ncbi:Surfactin synthase subunit 2 [compost metagenome]
MYPLALEADDDWAALLDQARRQLRQTPDRGVGFLPLRAAQAAAERLPLPWVALNYLGESRAGGAEWTPLPVAPGRPCAPDNPCAELVSLHGGIYDGRLVLQQIGSLLPALSERLVAILNVQLRELAAYLAASPPPALPRREREVQR